MNKPETNIQQVLGLMQGNLAYQKYFFVNSSSLKIFETLKKARYFEPEKIDVDSNGNAQYWYPLAYLERISKIDNGKYSIDYLEVIRKTVNFSKTVKRINNHYLWWGFVKILINIPNDKIASFVTPAELNDWLSEFTEITAKYNPITNDISGELLNKFLDDASMLGYAEEIFKKMLEIRKSKKDESFSRRSGVELVWDDHWLWQTFQQKKSKLTNLLYPKIIWPATDAFRRTLEYEHRNSWINITFEQNYYRIYVIRVPQERLSDADIAFKEKTFKCFIKKYSGQQPIGDEEIFKSERLHTEPELILPGDFEFIANSKEELVTVLKEKLPIDISWNKDELFEEKLGHLYNNLYRDYSSIWFKSIEHGISHHYQADETLGMILKDLLLEGMEQYPEITRNVLLAFLGKEYQFDIYRRFALFFINKHWDRFSYLFPVFLNIYKNPLAVGDCELEIYQILENHYSKFDLETKKRIEFFIDDIPDYYREKNDERYENYWKYKWYSAISEIQEFKSKFSEARLKTGIAGEVKYEPERVENQGRVLVNISPLSKEELLNKDSFEIVKFLKEFKTEDNMAVWNGKPDSVGLSYSLLEAVKENPSKFINDLPEYVEVSRIYLRHIILGLRVVLNARPEIDWTKILEFINQYLKNPKVFPKNAVSDNKENDVTTIDLVCEMLSLLEHGFYKNSKLINENSIKSIEGIYNLVYEHLESEAPPDEDRNVLEYVYRSSLGKAVKSYIEFSIGVHRFRNGPETNWGLNKYERFLQKGIEANIWFGAYLLQMRLLDKSYVETKIEKYNSLPLDNEEWETFIEAYLEGSYISEDVFWLMHPLYIKVLESKTLYSKAEEKLIQHICIGYLEGFESLEKNNQNGTSSLFRKLIDEANTPLKRNRVVQMPIALLEFDRAEVVEKNKIKIMEYWKWIYANKEFVKRQLEEFYEVFQGRVARFLSCAETIDDEIEQMVLMSVPYSDKENRVAFLIEHLAKFDDEVSLKKVGGIFKEILKYSTPNYDHSDIKRIVKNLAEFGLSKRDKKVYSDAMKICHIYGERGSYFLKDEFKEYGDKWVEM